MITHAHIHKCVYTKGSTYENSVVGILFLYAIVFRVCHVSPSSCEQTHGLHLTLIPERPELLLESLQLFALRVQLSQARDATHVQCCPVVAASLLGRRATTTVVRTKYQMHAGKHACTYTAEKSEQPNSVENVLGLNEDGIT